MNIRSKLYRDISHSNNLLEDIRQHMYCIYNTRSYCNIEDLDISSYCFGIPSIIESDVYNPEINEILSKHINNLDRRFVYLYLDVRYDDEIILMKIQGKLFNNENIDIKI